MDRCQCHGLFAVPCHANGYGALQCSLGLSADRILGRWCGLWNGLWDLTCYLSECRWSSHVCSCYLQALKSRGALQSLKSRGWVFRCLRVEFASASGHPTACKLVVDEGCKKHGAPLVGAPPAKLLARCSVIRICRAATGRLASTMTLRQ